MDTQKRAKPSRSKFQRHVKTLMWKAYLQRQRRWRLLVLEAVFAGIMFTISLLIAKPVFLTTLEAEPEAPLTSGDIIASLSDENIVGYAPDIPPYTSIMATASQRLGISMLSGATEEELDDKLYDRSRGTPLRRPIIWVLWKPTVNNTWQFSIRSTERARYVASSETRSSNPHLRSGFLAVQLAVSEATLSYVSWKPMQYELSLVSMPVSPLMQQARVQRAIAGILLCFILALLPPVLETQALVVTESMNRFKQSLRIRGVAYSSIYLGWLTYAYMTALPICILASITLIQIFRWVHIILTLIIVLAYISVMIMLALIMALFHRSAVIACTWTTLFTLMQLFLAELIIHHRLDVKHGALTFVLHLIIPPLGLEHGFNEFALLQTGETERWKDQSLTYTLLSWLVMILSYFCLLMLLQRTLKDVALGGQVSWKSIIFKKSPGRNQLHRVETPSGHERDKLQEVDELTAKAVSMRNVSKGIMGGPVLSNVTLDVYRGELTMLFSERVQSKMLNTIEDLLTGLTYPDKGSINILGEEVRPGVNFMSMPYMTGYCHRSQFLVDELTVEEHLGLYCSICLWNESNAYTTGYCHLRSQRLLADCDLTAVQNEYVRNLDEYYRAQLCWAIALLLEPRVVILPSFSGNPTYRAVIKDKIMEYRGYITIIKSTFTSLMLEYADRVFIFDNRLLVFGGTPAYMFFKYGRDYRLRITLRSDTTNEDVLHELLENASKANATVRAHLSSLLILRLPTTPTSAVAEFIKYLSDNSSTLGIMSMSISVPDSEEVCNRAIFESRSVIHTTNLEHHLTKTALLKLSEPVQWVRTRTFCSTYRNLKYIAWKFFTFHTSYRFFCIITVISALVTGVFIGLSFTKVLSDVETNRSAKKILHGEVLTVEALEQKTTLILRLDNSSDATSIALGYVFSETGAKQREIENVHYTALSWKESLTEYLVTLAIDSPQHYVYMYAYGMDVAVENSKINVQVLYSPLHRDAGAAARSLARAFTALMRHATGSLDATIRVTDDPLALDLSVWLEEHTKSPFLVQFLLILSISHMTLLPSKESGFIRHAQCNARNSSPACYWFALFLCDLFLYGLLVGLMTAAMVVIMLLVAPSTFYYTELAVLPLLLIIFGAGCIPQAYLFSLSNHTALNTMIYVMINVVFGETTVLAKILYGNALSYALQFLSLSPQFNMGYAFVKIKNIFLYNSECVVFERKNLCSSKMLHKCCPKCGVLQDCFSKRFYLTESGILMEVIAILLTTVVFMVLLLLWEYKSIQTLWKYISSNWLVAKEPVYKPEHLGAARERLDAINKNDELHEKNKRKVLVDTFGECLLACNVTQIKTETYSLRNIYLGLSRGEALAVSGLKDHGRERLCQILAGYTLPNAGQLWCMSKWRADQDFHLYARQISFCGSLMSLPPWMTVYNGLELMAVLRGVPRGHIHDEVMNYIDALELRYYVNTLIERVPENCRMRVRFAAAVVGAPPVLILDECTAYQKYSVRRAMYAVIYHLRQRGHAVLVSSSSVESHMPVTNRLAILLEGRIYDVDQVDHLVERFSARGFTVVVHLKDEVDVKGMFSKYFDNFIINDTSEVLVNVQVKDSNLDWTTIFEKMEKLQTENWLVYSYVVSATPIDTIYNNILQNETGRFPVKEKICFLSRFLLPHKKMITPQPNTLLNLKTFDERYSVTKLRQLPWSVIFQR